MALRGLAITDRYLRVNLEPARLRGDPAGARGGDSRIRGLGPPVPAGDLPAGLSDDATRRGRQGFGARDLRSGLPVPGGIPGAVPLFHMAVPGRREPVIESSQVVRSPGSGRGRRAAARYAGGFSVCAPHRRAGTGPGGDAAASSKRRVAAAPAEKCQRNGVTTPFPPCIAVKNVRAFGRSRTTELPKAFPVRSPSTPKVPLRPRVFLIA